MPELDSDGLRICHPCDGTGFLCDCCNGTGDHDKPGVCIHYGPDGREV